MTRKLEGIDKCRYVHTTDAIVAYAIRDSGRFPSQHAWAVEFIMLACAAAHRLGNDGLMDDPNTSRGFVPRER